MKTSLKDLMGVLSLCLALLMPGAARSQTPLAETVLGLDLNELKAQMKALPPQARLALDAFSLVLGERLSKQADLDPLSPERQHAFEIANLILALLYAECADMKTVIDTEFPADESPNHQLAVELSQILCPENPEPI